MAVRDRTPEEPGPARAPGSGRRPGPPGSRELGVVEAIGLVRDRCPHGAVRDHAAAALEKLKGADPGTLREQAFLVLSTLAGWRGDRAEQVKRSLRAFLERTEPGAGASR